MLPFKETVLIVQTRFGQQPPEVITRYISVIVIVIVPRRLGIQVMLDSILFPIFVVVLFKLIVKIEEEVG